MPLLGKTGSTVVAKASHLKRFKLTKREHSTPARLHLSIPKLPEESCVAKIVQACCFLRIGSVRSGIFVVRPVPSVIPA
jgi:hypothetical protein